MEFFLRQEQKQTDTSRRLNGIQRLKESALILALLSAVFIFVSLISYDSSDPSWSQTAWDGPVRNAAGNAGAWVADTLFFTLGTLAYPVPFLLLLGGWVFFRRRAASEPLNYTILATKILGVVLLLLTSCGLADLNFDDFWFFSSGGVVGDVLTELALPMFNILGTTLVFMFVWAAGFTLFTGISWLTIVDTLGEKTLDGLTWLVNRIRGDKPQMVGATVDTSDLDADDPLFSEAPSAQRELADVSLLNKVQRVKSTEVAEEKPAAPIIHASTPAPISAPVERKEPTIQLDNVVDTSVSDATVAARIPVDEEEVAFDSPAVAVTPAPNADVADERLPWDDEVEETQARDDWTDEPDVEPQHNHPPREDIVIGNTDGLSELDRAQAQSVIPDDEDPFLETIREAQKNAAGALHPFLVKDEPNLPKPTEPLPTIDLLDPPRNTATRATDEELQYQARLIETRLEEYKIKVTVKGIFLGLLSPALSWNWRLA